MSDQDKEHAECLNTSDFCPHADRAAKAAVKEVFAILGVNTDIPREVEEFRKDLRFGAKIRKTSDRMWIAVWVMAAVGLGYALWEGLRLRVGG